MTWIHAVRRQGVIAMLSIGLTIPAVGLAGAAMADSQGKSAGTPASAKAGSQGAAASNSHADNNGKSNGNGNGKSAEAASSGSSGSAAQADGSGNAASSNNGNGNSTTVDSPAGCPNSFHNSDSGNGANVSGAYDSTCDGSPSANGNGNGNAGGKPCAGCVGNADDKNPPGQKPDGSDHNNGYECDGNHGVGKTNPAHSGCTPGTTVDKCPDGSAMTDRNGDGKVNADDCKTTHVDTCPDGSPMTDRNGDGKVNADDCSTGHVDCPASVQTAADHSNNGQAKGKDNGKDHAKDNNGKANGKDKNQGNNGNSNSGNGNGNNGSANAKDKDCGPGHNMTCPDGSAMTDTNGDGKVNADDCNVDITVINHGNPPQVLGLEITAPTAVDAASATKPASLPFTGSNAVNMALIADLILLAGTLAIWFSGYRRQAPEVQG